MERDDSGTNDASHDAARWLPISESFGHRGDMVVLRTELRKGFFWSVLRKVCSLAASLFPPCVALLHHFSTRDWNGGEIAFACGACAVITSLACVSVISSVRLSFPRRISIDEDRVVVVRGRKRVVADTSRCRWWLGQLREDLDLAVGSRQECLILQVWMPFPDHCVISLAATGEVRDAALDALNRAHVASRRPPDTFTRKLFVFSTACLSGVGVGAILLLAASVLGVVLVRPWVLSLYGVFGAIDIGAILLRYDRFMIRDNIPRMILGGAGVAFAFAFAAGLQGGALIITIGTVLGTLAIVCSLLVARMR